MINKTVVLDGDCQLIIPEDGELGVISAIRKPYPPYTGDTIVTPSDSIQVLPTELTTLTENILINPVPGDYVGGDIPRRGGDDLTASGATVTAPAGYYEESASKTVPSGTEGTPTATKSAVSNHSVSVTPSVTNAAGYISGGTKTGEPVTVTASELESGTKSITANGEGIDVTGYAAVDVDVPSSEPTLQTITKTYTPSTSQQTETVTASAGYDAIEKVNVTVNAMPTGTEGTPTATKGTVSNHSVAVTPSVTNAAGYIPGGTKTGTPVTVSASELDSGTKSITANGSGQDVVGYASVNVAVPNSYTASDEGKVVSNGALVSQTARSISANGTYDTTTNDSVSVNVPSQSPVINPLSVTENGTYTAPSGVDGYSPVTVNVSGGGGGGIGDLILTQPLGTISGVPTTATDTGYDLTVTGINSYDLLIIIIRTDPQSTAARHRATTSLVFISGKSNVATKNNATVVSNKQQLTKDSGTISSNQSNAAYGVYPNNATLADNAVTMDIYARRADTYSGAINGYYTAYVYGVKLYKDDY